MSNSESLLQPSSEFATAPRAGLWRRLAALFYDWLILIALWMLAMALGLGVVALLNSAGVISFTDYADPAAYVAAHKVWFQLYSIVLFIGFYLYFWCKGGQTLGMRSWRILLVQQNGKPVSLKQAAIRAVTALLGLGNLWLLIRYGKGLALQDQLSDTQIVVLTKQQSSALNLYNHAR